MKSSTVFFLRKKYGQFTAIGRSLREAQVRCLEISPGTPMVEREIRRAKVRAELLAQLSRLQRTERDLSKVSETTRTALIAAVSPIA